MAIIPRAGAMPAPANVSNTRLGPPTRVISSSSSSSSVEELPGGEGVHFDSAAFGHFEEPTSFDRGGRGQNQNFNHHPGNVNAPTQAFAAMLESGGPAGTDNSDGSRNEEKPPTPGLVSMVISTYETNAKVVSGEMNILGTSVSLVL